MDDTIRLGVSTCLLGENVRYDGGHKLDRFIRDTLGMFVEFVPVCPEVECGLPVPREAMRLVGTPADPRLVTIKTGIDHTTRMREWGTRRLDDLEKEDLCGYIFKSRSPSSGMERIKVYNDRGGVAHSGVGIWARMFMDRFPLLPVEDEGRLHDQQLRENFIERIFVYRRWRTLLRDGLTVGRLVDFHTRHKLLIMSHSVEHYRLMGRLVAGAKGRDPGELAATYLEHLATALKLRATVKKNVNVLQHMAGYFKKELDADGRRELADIIEDYHRGLVPLIVPVTIINHYVRLHDEPYLREQVYLHPHPVELKLRNHA